MVTGHGLEEKGGETGDREVGLEEQEKGEGFVGTRQQLGRSVKKTGMERRMRTTFRQKIETQI